MTLEILDTSFLSIVMGTDIFNHCFISIRIPATKDEVNLHSLRLCLMYKLVGIHFIWVNDLASGLLY